MNNRYMHNKTSLFLMEIIIAILFFSLSAAVCVKLFVSAHLLSDASVDMTNAVLHSRNVSEIFEGKNGSLQGIADYFSETSIVLSSHEDDPDTGTLVILFDEDWDAIDYPTEDGAVYDADYELILTITRKAASEVYSDTDSDTAAMRGNALVGDITVLKLDEDYVIGSADEADPEDIISGMSVDHYEGPEES